MSGGIVAVTSLALEARIALGPGVSVICSQGPYLAAHLESAIKGGVLGIISFGIAGGLAPELVAGQWVAAAAIETHSNSSHRRGMDPMPSAATGGGACGYRRPR